MSLVAKMHFCVLVMSTEKTPLIEHIIQLFIKWKVLEFTHLTKLEQKTKNKPKKFVNAISNKFLRILLSIYMVIRNLGGLMSISHLQIQVLS
jgi:hypothetical protein